MQVPRGLLRKVPLAAGLCTLSLPILLAQQPTGGGPQPGAQVATEGTAAISGVATDATTGQPIAGVMVYLGFQGRGAVGRLSRQISDEKGRFVFTDLPAGNNYFINASRFGYLQGHYGTGAGGQLGGLITLADGQWFSEANVSMRRPAAISGTVVDERGEPAVGVFVRVLARIQVAGRIRLAAGQTAKTDDRGVYRLADLAPGRYVVQVPFVQQGVAASLSPAELAGMTPEQATAGRGIPDPQPALDLDPVTRLVVGGYVTAPLAANGRPQAYPAVFYPSASTIAAASVIELRAGEDRTAIDLSLRPAPATSISGVVEGPADVLPGLVVRLLPEGLEELGNGSEAATTTIGADGRFTLFNVPAGAYTLDIRRTISELQYRSPLATPMVPLPVTPGTAMAGGGGGGISSGPSGATYSTRSVRGNTSYFASMKLTVDARPMTNVSVPLKRGPSIRGRLVNEAGETPGLTGGSLPVYAEPADGNLGLGMLTGTRPTPTTFEIHGLLGGEYLLRFIGVPGSIKAITVDGEDYRYKPFNGSLGRDFDVVVTLTDKRTELSGSAADARGQQVKNAIVIAFPVEREQWTNYGLTPQRLRGAPTSSSGTYRFQSLPQGDYYVVAVPAEQGDAWQDPAKLAALVPSAVRVTLAWGDVKTQAVTVVKLQ